MDDDRWKDTRWMATVRDWEGVTWHATKEDAESAARERLAAAVESDPERVWLALWCNPCRRHRPRDEEAGRCYSAWYDPP